jgi:steroid 5-alpha reductase family enzyme
VRYVKDKVVLFMSSNGANSDNIVGNQDKVREVVLLNLVKVWSYKLNTQGR